MKKIGLLLGAEPNNGGQFQYSQTMMHAVGALPAQDYSVVVAYMSKLWAGYIDECGLSSVYVKKGFWGRALGRLWRIFDLPVSAWRKMTPYFHPIAKALLKEGCHLWIIASQEADSFQFPVPALATIHDLMHRYETRFPEVSARGGFRLREWSLRNTCQWAKGILVDSEVGKAQVMESYGLRRESIFVLPYIVPEYIYSQQAPADFNLRYQLPEKYIFYPAQFWRHKNHLNLINAMGYLKNDIPDLKLVLAGSKKNGYKAAIKQIQSLRLTDDVIILGYVPDEDMPELYRRARAMVMPTFFGPTNIPPLEAFAVGCPVAVSGIYGIPAQVGDAALLFNPGSVCEIAECIRRLWIDDNLCLELVDRGKRRVAKWGQEQFNSRLRCVVESLLRQ